MSNKSYPKPKKRIMRAFKLNEMSTVDRGAQEGAKILLLKRHEPEDVDKSMGLADVLTSSVSGHQHGVQISSFDGEPHIYVTHASGPEGESHSHDIVRGPDGTLILSENEGHTHDLDATLVQMALMNTMLNKVEPETPENSGDPADDLGNQPLEDDMAEKNAGDQSAELAKKDDTIARLQAVVDLSPEHRAHYDALTVKKAESFLAMSDADKDAAIEAIEKANPVVYTDGQGREYRKNDDARLVEMAKERDADRELVAKLRVENEHDLIQKKAQDLLGLVPGDQVHKMALVRKVHEIEDEEARTAVEKILETANKVYKSVMTTKGVNDLTAPADQSATSAGDILDAAVAKCAQEDEITPEQALKKILATPQGAALYDQRRRERLMASRGH